MVTDTKDKKPKKFMFDLYCFDQEDEDNEEDQGPPLVYTEDDLEKKVAEASEKAFQKGFAQAAEESKNNQEEYIGKLLNKLTQDVKTLYDTEEKRRSKFVQDSIVLAMASFQSLFPAMLEREGQEELQKFMEDVISRHDESSEIRIQVAPDNVENLYQRIKDHPVLKNYMITVIQNDKLGQADCRIQWAHGGAIRNVSEIVKNIESEFRSYLDPEKDDKIKKDNQDVQNGEKS